MDCRGGRGHSLGQGGVGLKWYNLRNYSQFYVGGVSSVRRGTRETEPGSWEVMHVSSEVLWHERVTVSSHT